MSQLSRRLLRTAAVLGMLAIVAVGAFYAASEFRLRKRYDVRLAAIAVPTDPGAIAEGRRLATIRGCNDGCHGKGVSGGEFWSEPGYARIVAPDLTRVVASHSDAELERVIRQGVRKDGRSTFGMPSTMFHHLTDADLGSIIAFLRSLPIGDGPETETHFGPYGRLDLLRHPEYAYAEEIRRDAPWLSETDLRDEHGRGRYLAVTVCSECHGMDLSGSPDGTTPDLVVVGGYSHADFARLMKTGIAVGDRQLGLMSTVARTRFSQLHDREIQALYDFLSARALEPQTYE